MSTREARHDSTLKRIEALEAELAALRHGVRVINLNEEPATTSQPDRVSIRQGRVGDPIDEPPPVIVAGRRASRGAAAYDRLARLRRRGPVVVVHQPRSPESSED